METKKSELTYLRTRELRFEFEMSASFPPAKSNQCVKTQTESEPLQFSDQFPIQNFFI